MARSGVLNVYIKDAGPRARWIFRLILEELLGLQLNYTSDPVSGQALLNYSSKEIPGSLNIIPSGILGEKGVKDQHLVIQEYEGIKTFFRVEGGDLPFDLFSMAFYLVSRYEEYLPFKEDRHGRFPHTESLAYREGFLDKAVVNRLAILLKNMLGQKFPGLEFNMPGYSFLPTVDVDIAFAHLGKGFIRTYGSMLKLLLRGKMKEVDRRIKSMRGLAEDPYDNFNFLLDAFGDLHTVFFILVGDPGPHDRNLSTKNRVFASLLKELGSKTELGLHPSYGAGHDVGRILKEKSRLEKVISSEITKSRQHFVRMRMPRTYEVLAEAGITDDYSMGYASMNGFRAGIASSYNFYNLLKEEESSLRIHPFVFMDTTLSDYMGLAPEEYFEAVSPQVHEVKDVKGTLSGIWHNYALADDPAKREAFEAILKLAVEI